MARGGIGTSMGIEKRIIYVDEALEHKLSNIDKANTLARLKKIAAINLNKHTVFDLTGQIKGLKVYYGIERGDREAYTDISNIYKQASILMQLFSACPGKAYIQTEMLPLFKTYQDNVKCSLHRIDKKMYGDITCIEEISLSEEQIDMIEARRKQIEAERYISPEQKKLEALEISASNIKLEVPKFDADTPINSKIKLLEELIQKRLYDIQEEDKERIDRLDRIQKEKARRQLAESNKRRKILEGIERAREAEEERIRAENARVEAARREEATRLAKEQKEKERLARVKKLEEEKLEEEQFKVKYGEGYKFELDLKRLNQNSKIKAIIDLINKLLEIDETKFMGDIEKENRVYKESLANNGLIRHLIDDKEHQGLYKEVRMIAKVIYFIEKAKTFDGIGVSIKVPDYTSIRTKMDIPELVYCANEIYKKLSQLALVLHIDKTKLWKGLNSGDTDRNSGYNIYTYGIPEEKITEIIEEYATINPKREFDINRILKLRKEEALRFCDNFKNDKLDFDEKQREAEERLETFRRNREIKESYENYSKQVNDELADLTKAEKGKKAAEAWPEQKSIFKKMDRLELIRYDTIAANFTMSFERATKIVSSDILFNKLAEKIWS